MKHLLWRFGSVLVVSGLTLFARPAVAQEERGDLGARLERLERRLNELAERQEQLMRQSAPQPGMAERREQQMMRRLGTPSQPTGPVGQPGMPGMRPPVLQPPLPPPAPVPGAEMRHPPVAAKGLHDLVGLLMLVCMVCNILLAVWIFTDIRKRNEGSGIFVALALVAGIPAALIYSLTRLGDRKS